MPNLTGPQRIQRVLDELGPHAPLREIAYRTGYSPSQVNGFLRRMPRPRPEFHTGAFGGRHSGTLENCTSKNSRYCREAAAGGRIPITAGPEHIMRASSIRRQLRDETTPSRAHRFTATRYNGAT